MKEKIQQYSKAQIGTSLLVLLSMLATVVVYASSKDSVEQSEIPEFISSDIEIATVDAGSAAGGMLGSSWPGEIISLANLPIQPSREGMIASWRVHVGERVFAGQVLGTLSPPPQMPDALAMVADEEKMVAMARTSAEAKRRYAEVRLPQLEALRTNIESSLAASERILGGGGSSSEATLSMIDAKKAVIRTLLRGSIVRTYPIMSDQGTLPARWNSITLKHAIGAQDSRLRDKFQTILFAVVTELDNQDAVPVSTGLEYFDLVVRLADASIPDGSMLTAAELTMLKDSLHEDQENFIMAADKLRETELMLVDTQKMAFEQLKMIEGEIAMLRQDLAMADGDLTAKEASARAIRYAVVGGSSITATRSGTVSAIMKRTGEYVMPGVPIAIVTGEGAGAPTVRFRVPINVPKPRVGDLLTVVRSAFPDDPRQAKLIGIGTAVDDTGAYMADAIFTEANAWPVGGSVRVLMGGDSRTVVVAISSIIWDEHGTPYVWGVSGADRLYAKKLKLGRTLGASVEVYEGLIGGDRYIVSPTSAMHEDVLQSELAPKQEAHAPNSAESMDGMNMEGMHMDEHE